MTDSADAAKPAEERLAKALRGFGLIGIVAIIIIFAGNFLFIPMSAVLVLIWRHFSRTPWSDLGFIRPKSWPKAIAVGIVFGVALKIFMKAIVMPLLGA